MVDLKKEAYLLGYKLLRPLKEQPSEKPAFYSILDEWQNAKILGWFMTEWCNYKCPYCFEANHSRKKQIHCFDNASPQEWVTAIENHFKDTTLELHVTGGEPMLDAGNMAVFLSEIVQKNFLNNIFITTNFAWNEKAYDSVDKSKIYLMGSFHPSHISIANFVKKTQSLLDSGWKIGFVNYMMTSEQAEGFFEASKELSKIGIPLNPNPLVGATISSKQNQAIQQYLEETDYYFKMGNSAKGKICLYPTLSYEMTPTGYVKAGCAPANHGNIFSNKPLPKLPMNPIKCPFSSCLCLSQYSFVKGNDRNKGLNTVKQYSNDLRKKYGLPFI